MFAGPMPTPSGWSPAELGGRDTYVPGRLKRKKKFICNKQISKYLGRDVIRLCDLDFAPGAMTMLLKWLQADGLFQRGQVHGAGASKPRLGSPGMLCGLAPPLSPCELLVTLLLMCVTTVCILRFGRSEKVVSTSTECGAGGGADSRRDHMKEKACERF